MKIHAQAQRDYFRTPGRLGWLLLLPALATSFSAQAVEPEMNIECGGDGTAVITCHDSSNEWIVVSSPSLAGPWKLRLEPVIPGSGSFQMTVSATNPCEYFRLAPGQRFVDDFDDGDLEGWNVMYADPQATNHLTLEPTNGQLRIYGLWPGSDINRHVMFYRTNLMMADFALSIDILGWDESDPEDRPNIALVGRLGSIVPPDYFFAYAGGVGMRYSGDPTRSSLFLWRQLGDSGGGPSTPFEKTDPAKDYRLVFSGVGNQFTAQLYDLADGTLVAQSQVTDDTLTEGWIGLYVVEHGPSGTVDFWLDNFRAVGTTP